MSTFWLVCSASKSSSRKGHLVKIAENYELLAQRAKHRSKGPNANEGAAPSPAPIDGVARVQRPPIQPDIGTETVLLHEPFRRIVTALAQAMKRAEPKFVDVASVRLNMIADLDRGYDAALQAILTKRIFEQLLPPDPCPARQAIPGVPLGGSTAGSHGSSHPSSECRNAASKQQRGCLAPEADAEQPGTWPAAILTRRSQSRNACSRHFRAISSVKGVSVPKIG